MLYLLPILVILPLILLPVCVTYRIHITGTVCYVLFAFGLLSGLVKIPLRLSFRLVRGEGFCAEMIFGSGRRRDLLAKKKPSKIGAKITKALIGALLQDTVKLKKSYLYIRLGTGEAARDCILCALFDNIYKTVFSAFFGKSRPDLSSCANPDFRREIFILKLEGIFYLNHVKIILIILKALLKKSHSEEGR